jgi:hypothetical protein
MLVRKRRGTVGQPNEAMKLLAEVSGLPLEEQRARIAQLREVAQNLSADGRKLEGEQLKSAMRKAVAMAQEKVSR